MSFFETYANCARVCKVLSASFPGPQLLQPRISRLSGQQQLPSEPFARNEILRHRYSGASLNCSSTASLVFRANVASCIWSEQSLTAGTERRSRPLARRSCTIMGTAGMFEDVEVCHARSLGATWKRGLGRASPRHHLDRIIFRGRTDWYWDPHSIAQ